MAKVTMDQLREAWGDAVVEELDVIGKDIEERLETMTDEAAAMYIAIGLAAFGLLDPDTQAEFKESFLDL